MEVVSMLLRKRREDIRPCRPRFQRPGTEGHNSVSLSLLERNARRRRVRREQSVGGEIYTPEA